MLYTPEKSDPSGPLYSQKKSPCARVKGNQYVNTSWENSVSICQCNWRINEFFCGLSNMVPSQLIAKKWQFIGIQTG